QLWDDDGRRQSPAHLRDREQGIVGGDHDIAGGNDASAAAEAAALEATVGTGRRLSRSMAWAVARLTRMFSCAEALATDRTQARSAPAWKCLPLPLMSSARSSATASPSSAANRPWIMSPL